MHNSVINLIDIKNKLNVSIKENQKIPEIIAVSKTFSLEKIIPLLDYGHKNFGENKIQEALSKWSEVKNNYQDLKLHFDLHHGHGNLDRAIALLDSRDGHDFNEYVKSNHKFNPHIMFIAKKKIVNKWFSTLFPWLERCENEFGFKNLKGYETTRLYAFLAERYLSFWFKKYTVYKEQPWMFIENKPKHSKVET